MQKLGVCCTIPNAPKIDREVGKGCSQLHPHSNGQWPSASGEEQNTLKD